MGNCLVLDTARFSTRLGSRLRLVLDSARTDNVLIIHNEEALSHRALRQAQGGLCRDAHRALRHVKLFLFIFLFMIFYLILRYS